MKRPKLLRFALCSGLALATPLYAQPSPSVTWDGRSGTRCPDGRWNIRTKEICYVSLYRLVASPEQYNGRTVAVVGYLINSVGVPTLFPSRASFENNAYGEGIALPPDYKFPAEIKAKLNSGLAALEVVGIFRSSDTRYPSDAGGMRTVLGVRILNRVER
jgi:hypothetical protein